MSQQKHIYTEVRDQKIVRVEIFSNSVSELVSNPFITHTPTLNTN